MAALQRKLIFVFLEKELRDLSPNFHIHVSVSDLYIPRGVHMFSCSRIGRPIVVIYKSLTDTWMWKMGLRPAQFLFWECLFWIFGMCLCSVLLGINLGHWLSMFVYLLILPTSFREEISFSSEYRQIFKQFPCQRRYIMKSSSSCHGLCMPQNSNMAGFPANKDWFTPWTKYI